MGRSRGGLTTKIHALVDALGLPILLKLTEGQAHDGRSADDMLGGLGEGDVLLADRAYDSDAMRNTLAARGSRRVGLRQTHAEPQKHPAVQPVPLSLPKSRRTLLQQTQTLSGSRHAIRQARRQLPCLRPACLDQDLVAA